MKSSFLSVIIDEIEFPKFSFEILFECSSRSSFTSWIGFWCEGKFPPISLSLSLAALHLTSALHQLVLVPKIDSPRFNNQHRYFLFTIIPIVSSPFPENQDPFLRGWVPFEIFLCLLNWSLAWGQFFPLCFHFYPFPPCISPPLCIT